MKRIYIPYVFLDPHVKQTDELEKDSRFKWSFILIHAGQDLGRDNNQFSANTP
jgi:hypothetical protein